MGNEHSHYKNMSRDQLHREVESLEQMYREKDNYVKYYNDADNLYKINIATSERDKIRRTIAHIKKLPQY